MRDQSNSNTAATIDSQTHPIAERSNVHTIDPHKTHSNDQIPIPVDGPFTDGFSGNQNQQRETVIETLPNSNMTMRNTLFGETTSPPDALALLDATQNSLVDPIDPELQICSASMANTNDLDVDSAEEEFMSMNWTPQNMSADEETSDEPENSGSRAASDPDDMDIEQRDVRVSSLEPPFFKYHAGSGADQSESATVDQESAPIDWSELQQKDTEPLIVGYQEQLIGKRKYATPQTIAPPRKRLDMGERFHANINYARLYNRHVRDSLNWSTGEGQGPNSDYRPTRISASIYSDPKEGEPWSVDEKLMFFKALARYSIHRLDDIDAQLPSKSKGLILAYYCLLRDQLKSIKQDRVRYHPKYRYVFEDENGNCHTDWINMHFCDEGALYSKIPIAYEMSESFIRFEERQAELLRYDNAVAAPMKRRDYGPLFNYEGIKDLSASILEHNRVVRGRAPRDMQRDANILLEDLVVLLMRKIMSKVILNKLWNQDPSIKEVAESDRIDVTDQDIHRAIARMRYAPEDDHVFSWNHIWAKISESMKLKVIDTERSGPMTHQEAETYILFHSNTNRSDDTFAPMYHDRWQVCGPSTTPAPAFTALDIEGENLINEVKEEEEDAGNDTEKEIKSKISKPQIISIDEAFKQRKRAHYNSETEHEGFSMHMINLETAKLEAQDKTNSAIYEHIVLASMTIRDEGHDLESYSIQESIDILQEWDDASLSSSMSSSSDDESCLQKQRAQYVQRRKRVRLVHYQDRESDTDIEYLEEDESEPIAQKFTSRDESRRLQNMEDEYAYYSIYE